MAGGTVFVDIFPNTGGISETAKDDGSGVGFDVKGGAWEQWQEMQSNLAPSFNGVHFVWDEDALCKLQDAMM